MHAGHRHHGHAWARPPPPARAGARNARSLPPRHRRPFLAPMCAKCRKSNLCGYSLRSSRLYMVTQPCPQFVSQALLTPLSCCFKLSELSVVSSSFRRPDTSTDGCAPLGSGVGLLLPPDLRAIALADRPRLAPAHRAPFCVSNFGALSTCVLSSGSGWKSAHKAATIVATSPAREVRPKMSPPQTQWALLTAHLRAEAAKGRKVSTSAMIHQLTPKTTNEQADREEHRHTAPSTRIAICTMGASRSHRNVRAQRDTSTPFGKRAPLTSRCARGRVGGGLSPFENVSSGLWELPSMDSCRREGPATPLTTGWAPHEAATCSMAHCHVRIYQSSHTSRGRRESLTGRAMSKCLQIETCSATSFVRTTNRDAACDGMSWQTPTYPSVGDTDRAETRRGVSLDPGGRRTARFL